VSWNPSPDDIADRYGDARTRVVGLVSRLSGGQAEAIVPGTPRWTVRELVSHLVGGPSDLLAGKFDGAGSEEWTQAQVESRRGRSIAALVEEWDELTGRLVGEIRAGTVPAPVTFDVICHEQDLRGALSAEPAPDPLAVRFVTDGFGARLQRMTEQGGLEPLEIRDPESGWRIGIAGGTCAIAPEFEWFRALAGRRSAGQVRGFAWSREPDAYLDLLSPFGPLRETDVSD
jgi:uncharacterized protein (TIGR03083 family)